jgi:hypothetical protein
VASQNVSHRLIGQAVTQIGQRSDDAVISPASILTRHSHHQSLHVRLNGGSGWILSVFGTIELLGDEPSIPGQDGVGLGDAGDLSERFTSHTPPISARVARSGSLNPNLDGSFALRIRFSAARYSFCRSSSWFTDPVTYASSRNHFLFLMPTAYLTLATGRLSFLTIRACESDMLVQIQWQGRKMAVPLSQLAAIHPDQSTAEAIGDWHYWVAQGYLF